MLIIAARMARRELFTPLHCVSELPQKVVSMLSGKRCEVAQTTRMLAQKQPLIQRVRNSSLVEWSCAENVRG